MKTVVRALAAVALAGVGLTAAAVPAAAAETPSSAGGVTIVDQPDTGNLNNIYTVAPLGVPVLGLLRSINAVPGKILNGGYAPTSPAPDRRGARKRRWEISRCCPWASGWQGRTAGGA